jgi:telomere length regulation protein
MVLSKTDHHVKFTKIIEALPNFEVRNLLYCVLKLISQDYLPTHITTEDNSQWWKSDGPSVAAAAALIKIIVASDDTRKDHLITWLTSSTGAGIGDGIAIRRAVIVSLAANKVDSESILEKSLQQFGDQLYIRHTPTLQQEGMRKATANIKPTTDDMIQSMLKFSSLPLATFIVQRHSAWQ